ncbi:MAG: hypothetical protein Q8928_01865 [Bacteroidota bacterium]|nr:hypothetical protein [Bacteroidota bacterium]
MSVHSPILISKSKQLEGKYVTWLQPNHHFLTLEEPAWFVFDQYKQGTDKEEIAQLCTERYNLLPDNSARFVSEIIDGIENLTANAADPTQENLKDLSLSGHSFEAFSTHYYLIGEKNFGFRFQSAELEYYLHPLLKHLETKIISTSPVMFELFSFDNRVILRRDNTILGNWSTNESHLTKGTAFTEIINYLYDKTRNDWMMIIHASAVTNGKKSLVFPASPGSGKSTFAAMLHANGFQLLSDDFVPIGRTGKAYPFPAALSVKEGSVDVLSPLFPSLNQIETETSHTQKQVRYLSEGLTFEKASAAPVEGFVFVKYQPGTSYKLEEVSRLQALQLILNEAWVSPQPDNIEFFFNWLPDIPCYQLVYSDNALAMAGISQIFES